MKLALLVDYWSVVSLDVSSVFFVLFVYRFNFNFQVFVIDMKQ